MSDESDELEGPAVPGGVPVHARGRRIFISTSSVMTSTLIVAALGAFTLAFMTKRLGPSRYGDFVAALAFVTTAMLITDLGVNALTGREIARTPERAKQILGDTLGLRTSLSVLVIPIVVALSWAVYAPTKDQLFFGIAIASLAIPFDALRSVSLSYFVAGIRNHISAVVAVVQQVLFVGLIVTILTVHGSVLWCLGAYVISTVVSGLIAYYWACREVVFIPRFSTSQWRRIIAGSISIGLIQLVNLLYLKADTLLLTVMATTAQVGIYGVAYAIVNFYGAFASIITQSLLPILTRANEAELDNLVKRTVQHMSIVAVMLAMLTWSFSPLLIRLAAGPKFAGAYLPLAILSTALVFTYLHVVLGVSSVARNRHMRILYVSLVCLGLNVVGNVIAIPQWGIDGSATVTFITEAIVLVGVAYVFRQDVGVAPGVSRALLWPVVVAAALSLVCMYALSSRSLGLVTATPLAVAQIAVYFAALVALRALPDDYATTVRRVRTRLRPSKAA